jgi:hypothetical protein
LVSLYISALSSTNFSILKNKIAAMWAVTSMEKREECCWLF